MMAEDANSIGKQGRGEHLASICRQFLSLPEERYLLFLGNWKNGVVIDAIGCHLLLISISLCSANRCVAKWYTCSAFRSRLQKKDVDPFPVARVGATSRSFLN